MTDRIEVFLLGGEDEEIQDYRRMLHPRDTRLNIVELTIAPTYNLINSHSDYWPRRFSTTETMVDVNANVWISPFFGFRTGYLTSVNGQVDTAPGGQQMAPLSTNIFDFGFRFRNFFGISRRASSISFGIDYEDNVTKIDQTASERPGYETRGFKLVLDSVLPMTNSYATTLGVEIAPILTHHEDQLAYGSGTSARSTLIGASVGGRYSFDRQNQLFWKVSERLETNAFTGTVRTPDPTTGLSPSGVVVNQSLTLFQIGFTWAP